MPKPSNGKENIMIIYLKRICLLKVYFIRKLFAKSHSEKLEIFVQSMYVKMYNEYTTPYLVQAQSYESGSYSDAAI